MELARSQTTLFAAVVFRQRREQNRMYGDIDAHPKGVGPADHRQKPLLSKSFNQKAITRQHARMMDAHTAA